MMIGGLVNTTAKLVFSQPTTWNWISRGLVLFEVIFFSLRLLYFLGDRFSSLLDRLRSK